MDSNVTLPLNLDASFRISALNKRSALFLETSHSFCKSENRLILENSLKKAEFARKFDLYLKNFTIMIPQEPSDIKARIPRIIIVTISDWAIICKTGTVLFKTTSKILFFLQSTDTRYKNKKIKIKFQYFFGSKTFIETPLASNGEYCSRIFHEHRHFWGKSRLYHSRKQQ